MNMHAKESTEQQAFFSSHASNFEHTLNFSVSVILVLGATVSSQNLGIIVLQNPELKN
jgi:hypothetical protein